MPRKKEVKNRLTKKVGVEAIVKAGYEALYVRGQWMKKLKERDKNKRKPKTIRRK